MASCVMPDPQPLYFGDAGRQLFGWIHPAQTPSDLGVVVCAPFGREELCAHRMLLHLAAGAAADGMPALRFDYHGTGDSEGSDLQQERVKAWIDSVQLAIDELKRCTGVRRIALAGLRIGAALSVMAARSRDDVAALCSIVPVVSGRAFVRELRLLGTAGSLSAEGDQAPLEAGGFLFTPATQHELAAIDLLQEPVPPQLPVLVLDRDDAPCAQRWIQKLQEHGVAVEHRLAPGYAGLMEGTGHNVMPQAMLDIAGDWLRRLPRSTGSTAANEPPRRFAQLMAGVQEEAVDIHSVVPLRGVLSTAASAGADHGAGLDRRAIILLSAGIARRIGPSRLHVDLARRWAARGHAVLRLDLSGLGDSPTHPEHEEHTVYSASASGEVEAAVASMRSRFAGARCHVIGMCSGSYHGLKAAIGGAQIDSLVMINPLTFDWHPGDSLSADLSPHAVAHAMSSYRQSLFRPRAWRRVLDKDFSLGRAFRRAAAGVRMKVSACLREAGRTLGIRMPGDLGSDLEMLGDRGLVIHFVFASGEIGPSLLKLHAGRSMLRLQRRGLLTQTLVDHADHIFTSLHSRQHLGTVLDGVLTTATSVEPPRIIQVQTAPE